MKAIADATGAAHECKVLVEFQRKYPPTVNDPEQTRFAVSVMEKVVGKRNVDASVEPTMTGEHFSFMLLEKPGCYAFLGNGDGAHRDAGHGMGPCTLHSASYDFNDALLSVGATYWVKMAENFLPVRS